MNSFYKKKPIDYLFSILVYGFFIVFSFSILYPFLQQLNLSISNSTAASRTSVRILPPFGEISWQSYKRVLQNSEIYQAYLWTGLRCIVGTVITVVLTTMFAYPLSKKYCPFRTAITALILFTMYFSGGLIPTYLLIKSLGLIGSFWALVIPGCMDAFTVVLVRNYMMSLPEELDESAKIDGANEVTIFARIILPLCKPIIATVALWTILAHWNSWFDVTIYLNRGQTRYLQVYLRSVMIESQSTRSGIMAEIEQEQRLSSGNLTSETVKAAILVCTTFPMMFVYPFFQKYFVKGIMIGSLKG